RKASYRDLAEAAGRIGSALRAAGFGCGDRIGILIENRLEWLECCFGAAAIGATVVPFSTWSKPPELAYLLADAEIDTLFEDDALILYTSGSSARPKAVRLRHGAVIENGFNIGERMHLGPDDRVLLAPPLFWSYGAANALPATLTHGATLVLQGRFEPGEWL